MRLATLIASIAGALMLSSAAPEPAYAFEFCSGLKPPKPRESLLPTGCKDLCAQRQCDALGHTDSDPECRLRRGAVGTDWKWVWVCCSSQRPPKLLPG